MLIPALALAAVALLLGPTPAHARANGAPFTTCGGCHGIGDVVPDIGVSFDPLPMPGEPTTVTVRIASPGIAAAGFFATTGGVGTMRTLSDATELAGDGVTHSSPISATDGEATVSFEWTPPSEPSGTSLHVYALAANGNGRSQGDAPGGATFPVAWGCDLVILYADLDRDGVGSETHGLSGGCVERDGWAATTGDCNENNRAIFPGAEEVCNDLDDDCNSEVDEGTTQRPLFLDADGDGIGVPPELMSGCAPPDGFSAEDDDCDDSDATRFPAAEEVCDSKDNDCDARVDEDVRVRCGLGWCQRLATSCLPDSCSPGQPREEMCNDFDDDCDGVVDNDASGCDEGLVCHLGACLLPEDANAVAGLPVDVTGPSTTSATPMPVTPTEDGTGGSPDVSESPTPEAGTTPLSGPEAVPSLAISSGQPQAEAPTDPASASPSTSAAGATPNDALGCAIQRRTKDPIRPSAALLALLCAAVVRRRRPGAGG
jgi:hypothetical protein